MGRVVSAVLGLLFFACPSDSQADPRSDVIELFENVPLSGTMGLRAWIHGISSDQLDLGETLVYHVASRRPAFITMLQINSHGVVYVLMNDQEVSANVVARFPPGDDEVFRTGLPLGRETVLVVGASEPVGVELPTIAAGDDLPVLDPSDAVSVVSQILDRLRGMPSASAARIDYEVLAPKNDQGTLYTALRIVKYFSEISRNVRRPHLDLYIQFEFGSERLTESAMRELDVVGEALQDSGIREKRFNLVGHTDAWGDDDFNLELSRRRAAAAQVYLIDKFGVEASRLDVTGAGEAEPLIDGTTAEARAQNRRVVLELNRP